MSVVTLVVEIEQVDGSKITPVYECYGEQKFAEFVEWHEQNLAVGSTAVLKGYALNADEPTVTYTVKGAKL